MVLSTEDVSIVSTARANIVVCDARIKQINDKADYEISLKEEEIVAINVAREAAIAKVEAEKNSETSKIFDVGAKVDSK